MTQQARAGRSSKLGFHFTTGFTHQAFGNRAREALSAVWQWGVDAALGQISSDFVFAVAVVVTGCWRSMQRVPICLSGNAEAIAETRKTTESITMATRQGRLAEFNQGKPDCDQPVQVLCEDHNGTYLLPYDCAWRADAWRNNKTGEAITSTVVGWRQVNRR